MFQKSSNNSNKNEVLARGETAANGRKITPSIISTDMCILGNVMSEGLLDIDGRIDGNVKSEVIYVRSNGQIAGDIIAGGEVHIYGSVHGVIKSPRVCIYASAHVEGTIIHTSLSIEDGAYIDSQFKPFSVKPLLPHRQDENGALKINGSLEEYNLLDNLKLIE
jgi:cytoskeletal protein CcmA (bactofilin family)